MGKEISYNNKDHYTRRYLFIENDLDEKMGIEAVKTKSDKSDILNRALGLYFARTKGIKEND